MKNTNVNRIYTPNTNTNLFSNIVPGAHVEIKLNGNEFVYNAISNGIIRHSHNDTDIRMRFTPINNAWFGNIVISEETNDYNQVHVSEIEFINTIN